LEEHLAFRVQPVMSPPQDNAVRVSNGPDEDVNDAQHLDGKVVVSTTFALCVCMLAHSYLLISVFPYSGFMALHMLDVQEDNAAQYAGLIASAFMVGRAVTSIVWGQAADRYGRVWTLHASLFLSCVCSILFGITTSFRTVMLVRFLLGCSNGIMSTIKTLVSEICTSEPVEARTMSLVMGMWGWGFLVSPVISGILAEPVNQYPDSQWVAEGTASGVLLREYPFLLPNLLGASVCILGMGLVSLFIHETLPLDQRHDIVTDIRVSAMGLRGYFSPHAYRRVSDTLDQEDQGGQGDEYEHVRRSMADRMFSSTMVSILSQKNTRDCLVLFWGYSFVSLTVDEAFPLFCLSHTAGFGIPEKEIGKVMSCSGLIFALSQYGLYTVVYKYCGGLSGSMKVGTALSAPLMFFVPLSLIFNRGSFETLNWATFSYLSILLACHRNFSLVFFSSISVALNRTVSTSNRGAMNGISVLGGSIAKALGPAFAGLLTTVSANWIGRYASLSIFGTIGVLGVLLTWSTFAVLPQIECPPSQDSEGNGAGSLELKEQTPTTGIKV
jgi:MFS family permease